MDDAVALAAVDDAVARLKTTRNVDGACALLSPHNDIYWTEAENPGGARPALEATPEWRKAISFADWIDALHPKTRQWSRAQVTEEHEEMFRISFENGIDDDIWVDRQSQDIAPDGAKLHEPWRENLEVGNIIDCMDTHLQWYTSTILEIKADKLLIGYRVYTAEGDLVDNRGHYSGYDAEFDIWLDRKSHRIARAYTKTHSTVASQPLHLPDADASHAFANVSPAQRCKSPLFLHSLNRFGSLYGFSLLLDAVPALSTAELHAFVEWLRDVADYLTHPFASMYLLDVHDAVTTNLLGQLRTDVRAISVDVVSHWAGRLQGLLSLVLPAPATALRLDTWLWSVYMVYIRSPLLERQFQGVTKMVDLVQGFVHHTRPHLTAGLLAEWYARDSILDVLLTSHAEVLQRALELFRFGMAQAILPTSTLWALVLEPSADKSRVTLLYSFLVEMVPSLSNAQLSELWEHLQRLDLALYTEDTITYLVRLNKWLEIRAVERVAPPSAFDLLWGLIALQASPVQAAAQQGLIDILRAMDMKTLRQEHLSRCLSNLAASVAVEASLDIAQALLEQYPLVSYNAFTVPRGSAFAQLDSVVPTVLAVLPSHAAAAFRFLTYVAPLGLTFTDDELATLLAADTSNDRLYHFLRVLCPLVPLAQATRVFEWLVTGPASPWPLPRFRCFEQYFLSLNQAHGNVTRSLWEDAASFQVLVVPHTVLGIETLWAVALGAECLDTVNAVVPCLHALYHDTNSPIVQEEYMDQCCAHMRLAVAAANVPAVARCLLLLQHMVGQWEAHEVCTDATRPHGAQSPAVPLELRWNDGILRISSVTTIGEVQAAIAAAWKLPVGAVVLDWPDANRTHRVPSLHVHAHRGAYPALVEPKTGALLPAVAAVAASWYPLRATAIERYRNTNVYHMFQGQNDGDNYDEDEWLQFLASMAHTYPGLVWEHLVESGYPPAATSLRLRLVSRYFDLFLAALDVLDQDGAAGVWALLQRLPSYPPFVVALDAVAVNHPALALYQLQVVVAHPSLATPALVERLETLVCHAALGLEAHAHLLRVLQPHTALDLARLGRLLALCAATPDMTTPHVLQLVQSTCYMWTQHHAALEGDTTMDAVDTDVLLELLLCPTSSNVRQEVASTLLACPPAWCLRWLPDALSYARCTEYFCVLAVLVKQAPPTDGIIVDGVLARVSATLAAPTATDDDVVVAGCLQLLALLDVAWTDVAPIYEAYLKHHWSPACRHEMYSLLQHFAADVFELFAAMLPQLPPLEHFATAVPHAATAGLVGLKNNGNTCFMNSILQQLYWIPTLRSGVLSADATNAPPLVAALQTCFGHLQASRRHEFSPLAVAHASPFESGLQQDAQQFFLYVVDQLEAAGLHESLTGSLCHQLAYGDQKRRSTEDFCCLSLDVQHLKSLDESLAQWSVADPISGFDWDTDHRNVNITKQALLNRLPPYLLVHLNRFTLNYHTFMTEKVNAPFSFPLQLNVAPYVVEEGGGRCDYTLVGIVVHSGTAQSGHYYSYVQTAPEHWIECNDTVVRSWHLPSQLEADCFGSEASQKSAYLLMYTNAPATHWAQTPQTSLPPPLQEIIDADNRRCALEQHFLQPDFYSFLLALLDAGPLAPTVVSLATTFAWQCVAKTTETALLPSLVAKLLPLWTPSMAAEALDAVLLQAPTYVLQCPDALVRQTYVTFLLHVLGHCDVAARHAALLQIMGWIDQVGTQWMRMEQYWSLLHAAAEADPAFFTACEALAWCHAFVLGQPTFLVVGGTPTPPVAPPTPMGNAFLAPKLASLLALVAVLLPSAPRGLSLGFFQRLWHWLPQADDAMATAFNRVLTLACADDAELSLVACELVLGTLTHGSTVHLANPLLALVALLRLPDNLQATRAQWLLVRRGVVPRHWGLLYALFFGRHSHGAWCHKVLETIVVLADEVPPVAAVLGGLFPVLLHHNAFVDWIADTLGAPSVVAIPVTFLNPIPPPLRYKRFQLWSGADDRVLARPDADGHAVPELVKQDEKVELLLQVWHVADMLEFHVTNHRQQPLLLTLDVTAPTAAYVVREGPPLTL
ncbi:hypothetical protein ACHHYP_06026, partial [Achlya hypogyna]